MSVNLKIDPYGFREYDARWLYEKDINLLGITNLGKGLGTQIIKNTKKNNPRVIVGHDYSCLLYTSPSPRDAHESRMPSSA